MEGFIPVKLKVRKFIPEDLRKKGDDEYKWEDFEFNLCNMSHWKPYVSEDAEGKPMLFTHLYMRGNKQGLVLELNGEGFLKACKEAVIEWKKFLKEIETGGN
jgi:hypothetical protein